MLVCSLLSTIRTRDRGCSAHPAFPAPSICRGREVSGKARAQCVARTPKCVLDNGATTNTAVVPALSTDAQLRIGGPIATGRSFANGVCYRASIERSRGMGPGLRRDDVRDGHAITPRHRSLPASSRACMIGESRYWMTRRWPVLISACTESPGHSACLRSRTRMLVSSRRQVFPHCLSYLAWIPAKVTAASTTIQTPRNAEQGGRETSGRSMPDRRRRLSMDDAEADSPHYLSRASLPRWRSDRDLFKSNS